MAVIPLDAARRRRNRQKHAGQGPAKILSFAHLSDGVLLRVIQRAGKEESQRLEYVYQLTRGEPDLLPTWEQMEEMENGTIEF